MFVIVGAIIVLACVIGGFVASGGHLAVLWQPFEFLIIGGAAVGSFLIGNPKAVIARTAGAMMQVFKGPRHGKAEYFELMGLLFTLFRLAKTKGNLALESHVENPSESDIFQSFPSVANDHHVVAFITDYLRLLLIGADKPYELEALMDQEIETHHAEFGRVAGAVQTVADALPALGIVAAVLGVIHTMGAITEPPEILGGLIGGALVGTFLGVLLSYGFVGPIAASLKAIYDADTKYLECIKAAILAYMQGYAPAIAVEFARKSLMSDVRPTFYELEEANAEIG
jgi:chemotaxis protein MotA